MSVVIYKDGVMAADSRAYSGSSHPVGGKQKIHRMKDGSLLGVCSNSVGMPENLREWIEAGEDKGGWALENPVFEAIRVMPSGEVFFYNDCYGKTGPLEGDVFTIGSGRKYALGAIRAGADIYEAVQVAIECDVWCSGPTRTLSLNEETNV
ncbi:peptidase S14 [Pararhizobium qamdonense]|uniref:peptidase S14 n=1 Tax=Pararhizobium qamdonense TaxID=3031126 RepID=UPI0023E1EF93|nr:peptidase S14 [Pararhizobium qamdonense]